MKTFHLPILLSLLLTANFLTAQVTNNLQQPTSINSDGAAPAASAMLDVSANNKGILVPRMTSAERTAIASPATGLLVFDTTTGGFWFYNGTAWTNLSAPKTLADADNDTKIQVEESPDEDIIRFDVSGTEFGKMDGKTFHLHAGNSLFIGQNAGQNANVNNNNTFLGVDAGALTTTGSQNVFVGTEAGKNNTNGVNSTFVGYQTGLNNTGIENTFIGRWAGKGNTTGIGNTFIGKEAGLNNTNAKFNTFVGKEAGRLNNTGENNTFIGERAGDNNGDGSNNTYLGKQAGTTNVSGSGNVFLGFMAGANETGSNRLYVDNSNTASPLIWGDFTNDLLNFSGKVGIGTQTPAASAVLDMQSTDKGILVPRMTSAQRTAIASPATGLLVFDITTNGFWFYNGTTWQNLSTPKTLADADGDTKIQVEESPDEDIIRLDLGGTESMVLQKNSGGSPRLELPNALNNTFVGTGAGQANTTGSSNTANGTNALLSNTTGSSNTAIGRAALSTNKANNRSTAIGRSAMFYADDRTTGRDTYNTAVGFEAMRGSGTAANNTGQYNTAVGDQAMFSNSSGEYNTATGVSALTSNTTGTYNTADGRGALFSNTTGSSNTAVGLDALYSNKANSRSTAIGRRALLFADDRTTGRDTYNTAVGYEALRGSGTAANNTGQYNTAVGDQAMFSNTTGHSNTAIGLEVLFSNTDGEYNAAIGRDALYTSTTGSSNTAIGVGAMRFNTSGSDNTALGRDALYANTSGSENTGNGRLALSSNTTGSYNTALGSNADVLANNLTKATAIGYGAKVNCSNCMVLGGTGADAVKVGIGTTTPKQSLHVAGDYYGRGHLYLYAFQGDGMSGTSYVQARDDSGTSTIDMVLRTQNAGALTENMTLKSNGNVGIGLSPTTNRLEVNGNASKSSAGDWLANSDARLKKNIQPLNGAEMLQKLLSLQGVTYEWNDDKTGSARPEGVQYGFTAQNIQAVFPMLVEEDKSGYLQTAYGTYDAMTVEAIRALNEEIGNLKAELQASKLENAELQVKVKELEETQAAQLHDLSRELGEITAALARAGIALTK